MILLRLRALFWLGLSASATLSVAQTLPDLFEASVVELQSGMEAGNFTSVNLVKVRGQSLDMLLDRTYHDVILRHILQGSPK